MPLDPSVFVHPQALCESETIGPRTRIWAFAHVLAGAVVGADCNLCDHVYVEGGAVIGDRVTVKNGVAVWAKVTVEDDVFLGPGAALTNDLVPRAAFKKPPEEFLPTLIARGATVGANATIVCGVTIGRGAFVGAGAVVVNDVPAHALVIGNPARQVAWICACGERLGAELACAGCGRRYQEHAGGVKLLSA
jgi:acetyltransferase-like isoleucine patch superfamily enzyme